MISREGLKGLVITSYKILKQSGNSTFTRIDDISYNAWLKEYFELSDVVSKMMKEEIDEFQSYPKISVIIPTFNSNVKWLKEAIRSIQNQIYENWEICISDDASSDSRCIKYLKELERLDPKIKVIFRKENGHISQASNSAISLATGEWLALFDHDDILSSDALYWVAKAIVENSNAALIYSDEDKINYRGLRQDPYFKCDWNYDLFLSQNMISHLGVYRTDIVKEIGGFRPGYEGSQDYDLALRFIEKISDDQIIHIPRVLYHWRIHKQSTAKIVDKKPYALISAQEAITEHLIRKGVKAEVTIIPKINMYRVKYTLQSNPSVSIIIPTKDNYKMLKKCINSIIEKSSYPNYNIIVVNNNSTDQDTTSYLEELSQIELVTILEYYDEFNFSAINNVAAKKSNSDYICFLNDDTEVITHSWLEEMISIAEQDRVGVVGAKLKYANNTLQHAGVILGVGGVGSHSHKGISENTNGYFNRAGLIQSMSAVTGACLLIRRDLFNQVGGFNAMELAIAYNDVDLCLRVKELGYRVVYTPFAELYHYESASRGSDTIKVNEIRLKKEAEYMYKMWSDLIANDPAYSPNLTLTSDSFSLAWPPRV